MAPEVVADIQRLPLGDSSVQAGLALDVFLDRVRELVQTEIERCGVLRIGNQVGMFICR